MTERNDDAPSRGADRRSLRLGTLAAGAADDVTGGDSAHDTA